MGDMTRFSISVHFNPTLWPRQAKFIRMKSTSKKRTPRIVNLTVKRRYLTQREIERLMDCARKHGRYGHRDATMILVAYRHGLRAAVTRCGLSVSCAATALKRLTYSFPSEAGQSPIGFHRLIQRVGEAAKMPSRPTPTCHACGFKLANDGYDTRALQH
jgi:hypothetical protein